MEAPPFRKQPLCGPRVSLKPRVRHGIGRIFSQRKNRCYFTFGSGAPSIIIPFPVRKPASGRNS